MAGELTTSTTANDIYFAPWVGDNILDEVRPFSVIKPLIENITRKPALQFSKPLMTDPGAAAAWSEKADQATREQTLTSFATGAATVTSAMKGMAINVSDIIDAISVIDAVSYFAQVLGRSLAEKFEVDAATELDVTGADTTASTVLLLDDFFAAVGVLEANDARGDLVAVLSPVQVSELRRDLTGTVAASFFGSEAGARVAGDVIEPATKAGFKGNIGGVDVYETSAVVFSTTYRGSVFVKGEGAKMCYEVWGPRTESHRDPLVPGTIIVATQHYGVDGVRDSWIQGILST